MAITLVPPAIAGGILAAIINKRETIKVMYWLVRDFRADR